MRLKVGDLAKRSGLTVRTLHHYHAIGLLTPSARADNGYRLYDRNDIARLHQIQALRRFGLSLTEIGDHLNQLLRPFGRKIVAASSVIETMPVKNGSRMKTQSRA